MEEEKNKKTNQKTIILLIIIILLLLGVGIYFILNKQSKEENNTKETNDIKVITKYDDNYNVEKGYVYFKDKLINESNGKIGNINIDNKFNIYIVTYTEIMSQSGTQTALFITKTGDLIEIPCEKTKDLIKIGNEDIETSIIGITLSEKEIDIYKTCGGCTSLENAKPYGYKYTYIVENNKLVETKKEEISSLETIHDIYDRNRNTITNTNETKEDNNKDNNKEEVSSENNSINKYVTVKSLEIEEAKVVNAPNNHIAVTGKINFEIKDDRFFDMSFEGGCYDIDNNYYSVNIGAYCGAWAPFSKDGIQDFCGSETYNIDYGEKYNLYANKETREWKDVKFKSCRFYKMNTLFHDNNNDVATLTENVEYSKEFN